MPCLKNCAIVLAALCILSVMRTAESSASLDSENGGGGDEAMLSSTTESSTTPFPEMTASTTTANSDVVDDRTGETLLTILKPFFQNKEQECNAESEKAALDVEKDKSFFKDLGFKETYKTQLDAVVGTKVAPWLEKINTFMDLVEKGDENGLLENSEIKSSGEKSPSTAPTLTAPNAQATENDLLVANNDVRFLRAKTSVESSGQPLNEYWLHLRTFIPKAGSAAASGVDVSDFPPFDIRQGSKFSANYEMSMEDKAKDWGGWALGIYEPTELFDTNDRDWSNRWDDTENSKTYVKVHIKKNDAGEEYTIEIPESNGKGSSTTHHYCKVVRRGKCCSKTADWSNVQPLTVTSATNPVKFKLKVRVGNPCVPGSYIAGPIMYDMDFELDFSKSELKVSGKQSLFPAYELIHGSNRNTPGAEGRYMRWGVSGHNVYDLMKFPSAIPADTDAMV